MDERTPMAFEPAGSVQSIDPLYGVRAEEGYDGAGGMLRALARRWYVALAAAVIAAGLGLPAIWLLIAPKYVATSAIEIAPVIPAIVFQEESGALPFYSNYVSTQAQLIKSTRILYPVLEDPVVRKLAFIQQVEDPLSAIQEGLETTVDRRSQLLLVAFTGEDPKTIADITNAVVRAYMTVEGGTEATTEDEKLRTLERERDTASEKLRTLYEQARQLGQEYGTTDLAAREQIMLTRLGTLQDELGRIEGERLSLQTQALWIEGREPTSPSQMLINRADYASKDPTAVSLSATIAYLEQERVRRSLDYQLDGEWFKNLERQLAAMEARLEAVRDRAEGRFDTMMTAEFVRLRKEQREEIDARLAQLDAREKKVREELDVQNQAVISLGRKALDVKKLQDELQISNDLYQALVQRIQILQVERQRPARIRVAYPAEAPRVASRDKRMKYSIVLVMGALLFGCALTVFLHEMDMRVETPSDVIARARLRILGTTPRFKDLDRARVKPRHFADDCRAIRVNLGLAEGAERPEGERGRAIVMASPQGRDGKTTLAINLATSMALAGRRVLLVDGDLRKPEIARYLKIDNAVGLAALLAGECSLDDAIKHTPVNTLHVLPASRDGRKQSELLVSRRLSALLAELRMRYDEIIIDTPAVLAMPDAKLWACLSDGVILVARSSRTAVKDLVEAKIRLEQAGARILGAVLTGVRIRDSYEKYSHRYGEGYVEEPLSGEDWDAAGVLLLSRRTDDGQNDDDAQPN